MLASIKLLSLTLKLLVSPSKEYSDRLWTDDDIPTKSEHGGAHGRNPLSSNLSNPRSETRLPGRKDTKKNERSTPALSRAYYFLFISGQEARGRGQEAT